MTTDFPEYLSHRYHAAKHIDRVPFIINKPVSEEAVSTKLMERTVADNEVFIGIAGLRGLDLLCSSGRKGEGRYQQAVLFDINHRQVKATNAILQMVKESETPQQFIDSFTARYDALLSPPKSPKRQVDAAFLAAHGANNERYQPADAQHARAYLLERSEREDSFLQPDNFAHLKQLLKAQQVHTAILDLTDYDRMGALMNWMKDNDLKTGDVYVSSVLDFLSTSKNSDYWGRDTSKHSTGACEQLWRLLEHSGQMLYSQVTKGGAGFALTEFKPESRNDVYRLVQDYNFNKFYHDRLAHGSLSLIVEAQGFGDVGEKLLIEVVTGGPLAPPQVELMAKALSRCDVKNLKLADDGMSVVGYGDPEVESPIRNKQAWEGIRDALQGIIATHECQSLVKPSRRGPEATRNLVS